jgi:hypothetical protein
MGRTSGQTQVKLSLWGSSSEKDFLPTRDSNFLMTLSLYKVTKKRKIAEYGVACAMKSHLAVCHCTLYMMYSTHLHSVKETQINLMTLSFYKVTKRSKIAEYGVACAVKSHLAVCTVCTHFTFRRR